MDTKYSNCFNSLNESVFDKILKQKQDGINRIISPFQLLSLDEKINQYASTSSVNCFGNCLEELAHVLIEELSGQYLQKRQSNLDFDNLFIYKNKIVLIEQKVRDDHDSSKKTGQLDNYLNKKEYLKQHYPEYTLYSCMWFIDPYFSKNSNYYLANIPKEELCYGKDIDTFLSNIFEKEVNFFHKFTLIVEEFRNNYKINKNPVNFKKYTVSTLYPLFYNFDLNDEIIKKFFGDIQEEDFIEYLNRQRACPKKKELLLKYGK